MSLAPGRHTITTANIPILSGLIQLGTSGKTPFTAEVYFVSTRTYLDMGWGTPEPMTFRDPDLGMVRLRANGVYSLEINDPSLFVNKVVGVRGVYETPEIEGMLRGMIISKMTDLLGEIKIPFLDMPAKYDEIGAGTKAKVGDDFKQMGITLKTLYVRSISPDRRDGQGHRRARADGRHRRYAEVHAVPGGARHSRCGAESVVAAWPAPVSVWARAWAWGR